ncbi:AAA family ATPase [Aurantimonas sp. HBX-1]|uniref:AAA family ATPase n=1 Tax=Aurantimonas sp. HBX-1 TaxID=2906072 RepID=UPI001F47227D|nr:AAA family ATPase [Aurantimonas sp. HBX-1]UIJ73345.1 AAA family ATPase [Aurantimonas sp. HBX-1]
MSKKPVGRRLIPEDSEFFGGETYDSSSRPVTEVALFLANPDLPTIEGRQGSRRLLVYRNVEGWSEPGQTASAHFFSSSPVMYRGTRPPAAEILEALGRRNVLYILDPGERMPAVAEYLAYATIDANRVTSEHLQTAIRMRYNEPRFTWPAGWSVRDFKCLHLDAAAEQAQTGQAFLEILGTIKREIDNEAAGDLQVDQAEAAAAAESEGTGPTVRVLTSNGKPTDATKRMWSVCAGIVDVDLPLRTAPRDPTRNLIEEWPHAADVVCRLLANVHRGQVIKLRPTILVGAPGTGKTSLLQAIASRLDVPSIVFPCATSGDNSFGGTPARWHTSQISTPGEAIRQHAVANPVIILDELEKSGRHSDNGSLVDALLPMLEAHTARAYYEASLDAVFDLSHVSFVATANSLSIPAPLRDRFDVIQMPDPGPEHIGPLAKRIVDNIRRKRGLQEGMLPPLDPDEEELIKQVWNSGSLRRLTRIVEALVDNRDRMQAHH